MNFLRKMLLIVVGAVFGGNSEGMLHQALPLAAPVVGVNILDFDSIANVGDNIPAMFQPKIYRPLGHGVGGNNLEYVYFTVINNVPGGVPGQAPFHAAQITVFVPDPVNEHNIYFPRDGHQPTTPEAVSWSCANIDNRENSPITEWYVRMFGGPGFNDIGNNFVVKQPITAGYTKIIMEDSSQGIPAYQKSSPIIICNSSMNVSIDETKPSISMADDFWALFRGIAADPVGRVLLYRILIELRRKRSDRDIGTHEYIIGGIDLGNYVFLRNNCRSITIDCTMKEWFFDYRGTIGFDSKTIELPTVKTKGIKGFKKIYTANSECNRDCALFHEMLHWFHFLRNVYRYHSEGVQYPEKYSYLINCYYGDIGDISELFTWAHIEEEEIRTILGAPDYNNQEAVEFFGKGTLLNKGDIPVDARHCLSFGNHFLPVDCEYYNGDDLSENVYRLSKGYEMRFGHGDKIKPVNIKRRFWLAKLTASACCSQILGRNIDFKF